MDARPSLGPRSLATMRTFLAGLVVLPYDQRVATRWGELQAVAQRRGRPRPANDTWIAACCLVRELPLATFNIKDFADYEQHEGLELAQQGNSVKRRCSQAWCGRAGL